MITENRVLALIDISSSGDNTIIVAPTGTSAYIAIDHINFVSDSAVSVLLKSDTNELSGTYSLTSSQGFVLENSYLDPNGVITCVAGEAFIINLDSDVQVSGFIKYRIVNQ